MNRRELLAFSLGTLGLSISRSPAFVASATGRGARRSRGSLTAEELEHKWLSGLLSQGRLFAEEALFALYFYYNHYFRKQKAQMQMLVGRHSSRVSVSRMAVVHSLNLEFRAMDQEQVASWAMQHPNILEFFHVTDLKSDSIRGLLLKAESIKSRRASPVRGRRPIHHARSLEERQKDVDAKKPEKLARLYAQVLRVYFEERTYRLDPRPDLFGLATSMSLKLGFNEHQIQLRLGLAPTGRVQMQMKDMADSSVPDLQVEVARFDELFQLEGFEKTEQLARHSGFQQIREQSQLQVANWITERFSSCLDLISPTKSIN